MTVVEKEKMEVNMMDLSEKRAVAKSELRRIDISEFPSNSLNLSNISVTKDNAVAEWLCDWIEKSLKQKKICVNNLLPKKNDLAKYFGVSSGTVQNAIRFVEDKGLVESKQRIGTLIKSSSSPELRKQTSKREQAIEAIKRHIINNQYVVEQAIPSSRELAKIIKSAPNTTRLALEHLAQVGIIEAQGYRGNKSNWIIKQIPQLQDSVDEHRIDTDTLVDQVERDLKNLICQRYKVNDKLPPHFELSEILKVSIKTIHDAMKRLVEQGILKSKRGRYGTFITRIPAASMIFESKEENSIFASATEASFYNYEKVERHIKAMLRQRYKIGDKIPSMNQLSEELNVSSNTIRKALQRLYNQNIVKFSRGRYGGTFIINMPKAEEATPFKWLALNPDLMAAYRN